MDAAAEESRRRTEWRITQYERTDRKTAGSRYAWRAYADGNGISGVCGQR